MATGHSSTRASGKYTHTSTSTYTHRHTLIDQSFRSTTEAHTVHALSSTSACLHAPPYLHCILLVSARSSRRKSASTCLALSSPVTSRSWPHCLDRDGELKAQVQVRGRQAGTQLTTGSPRSRSRSRSRTLTLTLTLAPLLLGARTTRGLSRRTQRQGSIVDLSGNALKKLTDLSGDLAEGVQVSPPLTFTLA